MVFKSPALISLWQDVEGISDPDRPLCCMRYAGRMPCCDLTPYVADMIAANDREALEELWGCFHSPTHLLTSALRAKFPSGFNISSYAVSEILAAYALALRSDAAYSGAAVMATTLSTRDFVLPEVGGDALLDLTLKEIREDGKIIPDLDISGTFDKNRKAIAEGISGCRHFADLMQRIPPMVRISLADMINASDTDRYHKKLHFNNGYDERCYGCSDVLGWEYMKLLGIVEPVEGKDGDVLGKMSREELRTALSMRHVEIPKSAKKEELVARARSFPEIAEEGLISHRADLCYRLKTEYADEGKVWARRNDDLTYFARAVFVVVATSAFPEK